MRSPDRPRHLAALVPLALTMAAMIALTPLTSASARVTPERPAAAATSGGAVATAAGPGQPVQVAAFQTEPVVLTGADFPGWSSGPEVTARIPELPTDYDIFNTEALLPAPLQSDCYSPTASAANGRQDPYDGDHNCFQGSQSPVRTLLKGVVPDSLRGYAWGGQQFVQIPFQVDTKWEHYLSNNASGFAFYSGIDQMLTYTFDYEPFLFTNQPFSPSEPGAACQAAGTPTTADPNPYLIDSDELSFMARDAGAPAPQTSPLPSGIVSAHQVQLVDPTSGQIRYVYVMESAPGKSGGTWAVPMAYTAANSPYVHYQPDTDARTYVYSQSSYSNYGNATYGPVCTSKGQPVIGQGFKVVNGQIALDPSTYVQRRTLDTATVTTPDYRFRYDGRWILDDLQVSPDDAGLTTHDYGTSLINRFKGRAFQQAPGGDTPCCGYEDEQVNWNGSSITMGVKAGPVRTIRVTWGADSGTNITRTDIFYAYSMAHEYDLRVHPIPPLDGIYTQWDMAAGAVTTYYNPYNPQGVPITGINPVLLGDTTDFVGPSGVSTSSNDKLGRLEQQLNGGKPLTVGHPDPKTCTSFSVSIVSPSDCLYGSFNLPDPTFSGLATEALSWDELTGPAGTMVEKWGLSEDQPLSAGDAQGLVEAVPYYVDDSCFDDGTGNGPGPQIDPRTQDPTTWGFQNVFGSPVAVSPAPTGRGIYNRPVTRDGVTYLPSQEPYQRRCWNHTAAGAPYNIPGTATYNPRRPAQPQDPAPDPGFGPQGDVRYYEGDIATHGLHLLFTGDADNAELTVPLTEVDATDNQVILPPGQPDVGGAYAAPFTIPVVSVVTPFPLTAPTVPQLRVAGPGLAPSPVSGPTGTGSSNPAASDSVLPAPLAPALPFGPTAPLAQVLKPLATRANVAAGAAAGPGP